MTDKELLELAAKAAGLLDKDCRWLKNGKGGESLYSWDASLSDGVNKNVRFDPLTEDGDALRLAVKLKMLVNVMTKGVQVDIENIEDAALESIEGDPYAATRRAITRAAAEIGKTLG